MKNFNHSNDEVIQSLFRNYLINQSVFSAIAGNKYYLDQARNLMIYPMTFESYCVNAYDNFLNNIIPGIEIFNKGLNKNSGEILMRNCKTEIEERKMFEQIKDVSFIYTNVINCYNSFSSHNANSHFSSKAYSNFVDDINTFGPELYNDKGLEINNELYGGRFCEETLNLLKKPMEEAEDYLLSQSNQSVFNKNINFTEDNAQ